MKPSAAPRLDALLCGFIAAAAITGALHTAAIHLPDWFSARGGRHTSTLEKAVAGFSDFWLANAAWLMPVVTALGFTLGYALFRKRPTAATPPGSDMR